MKRELLQNVKVQVYTSGDVLDREGYLSAVFGVKANGTTLKIAVTHSDDGVEFEPVTDPRLFPEKNIYAIASSTNGVCNIEGLEAGQLVNVDIDLLGCKKYIKITTVGASGTPAVALGDSTTQPV